MFQLPLWEAEADAHSRGVSRHPVYDGETEWTRKGVFIAQLGGSRFGFSRRRRESGADVAGVESSGNASAVNLDIRVSSETLELISSVSLGLTIHGAELTAYSGLPRLIPIQLDESDQSFSDALFEAEDAVSWRRCLHLMAHGGHQALAISPTMLSPHDSPVTTTETFLPMVVLAQRIVNTHMLRQVSNTTSIFLQLLPSLANFYHDMSILADRFDILPSTQTGGAASHATTKLRVLWHYANVVRLAPLSLIEEAAGRGGQPPNTLHPEIQAWTETPLARLATLHCAHILYYAANLHDLAFLLPR